MLRKQFLETTRGRIASLLQRGGLTAEEIAAQLRVTTNAVRAQLAAMQRDGLVRRAGQKRGATRPSYIFEVTPEVEQLLSGLLVPLLTRLVSEFSSHLPTAELKKIMRRSGKGLAADFSLVRRSTLGLEGRVMAASGLMNEQLGAATQVARRNGGFVIRGGSCPIAVITNKQPLVCLAVESFLQEIIGVPVRECCNRSERPRCCFEIRA